MLLLLTCGEEGGVMWSDASAADHDTLSIILSQHGQVPGTTTPSLPRVLAHSLASVVVARSASLYQTFPLWSARRSLSLPRPGP